MQAAAAGGWVVMTYGGDYCDGGKRLGAPVAKPEPLVCQLRPAVTSACWLAADDIVILHLFSCRDARHENRRADIHSISTADQIRSEQSSERD